MKTFFKLILILVLLNLTRLEIFSQLSWISQTSGVNEHLLDVQFLNNNTGYACGKNGTMIKTTNGGLLWSLLSGTNDDILKLFFSDENTGWIITSWNSPTRTTIMKTVNGGVNFVDQYNEGGTAELSDIYFSDVNNGWFVNSGLKKTTNSGTNWIAINQPVGSKIFFLNASTGFLLNDFEQHKTTNSGQNWITISNSMLHFKYLQFFNSTTGYTVLKFQGFAKTQNGGNNWTIQTITNNVNYQIHDAYFNDLNTGWATGYANDSGRGLVYKTFNGGINWFQQYVGTEEEIRGVSFTDPNIGWIVGYNGIIYKTTNGGGDPIGIQQISSEIAQNYYLYQNFPNPFNPNTKIQFNIPRTLFTKLTIYNITGSVVRILVNEKLQPGVYEVDWDASQYASGVYYYKLETDNFSETKRMVLLK